jgi:hypothetical protein
VPQRGLARVVRCFDLSDIALVAAATVGIVGCIGAAPDIQRDARAGVMQMARTHQSVAAVVARTNQRKHISPTRRAEQLYRLLAHAPAGLLHQALPSGAGLDGRLLERAHARGCH